jgi:transcriptional regulator with XRE-family HTH domain
MPQRRPSREGVGKSPLKKLRDELGMSQEELARQLGISSRTVSRWEAGDNVPTFTIPQIKALARLLESKGKTIEDLPDHFGPSDD